MNTSRMFLLIAALFAASAATANPVKVEGRVNILWAKPQFIQLVPDIKLYPGQSFEIVSSGRVDVDHQFGERRECNWFGLNCWYEQWDRPNWMGADALDVRLVPEAGNVTQAGSTYKLEIPLSAGNGNFRQGVRLNGMLLKSGGQSPMQRGPCTGRPAHCSQGDLLLTFAQVNVEPRLSALEAYLAAQKVDELDVLALTSRDFIDPLLFDPAIASEGTILRLSSILAKATSQFREQIPNKTEANAAPLHMKVIDLVSYALKLSRITEQDAARLRTLVTESYLDRGDYAAATKEAPKMMADAKAAFDKTPNDKDAALDYARALKANAAVWREKGARNSSTDIRVSIALLDNATDVLWKFSARPGVSKAISDINVDAARMLNLLRTSTELKSAEERLVTAICFQMHAEKDAGTEFEEWRKSTVDSAVSNCKDVRQNPT